MPSSIPYDPSLILGSIVPQEKLNNIIQISKLQAPADAAENELNSLIALKRSVDMTIQETMGMGINADDLFRESAQIGQQIEKAAVNYGKTKVKSVKSIQALRAKMNSVNKSIESPIDYNRSILKDMKISTDSLQMNSQYFSFDENSQSSSSHASAVSSFVGESVHWFGEKESSQASRSAQSQMNSQHSMHSIAGTLVVTLTCTHKNAQVFAPYYLDVDKAVRSWNAMFPNDMIRTNDAASIGQIMAKANTKNEKLFNIISGATYGSSFIGMVHVLNTTNSSSSQSMESVASSLQATFDVGGWFSSASGGFGVNKSFSDSAKNLLSTQNITSHATLITMGIIPSIKSHEVSMAVQGFSNFDPAESMKQLATLQGATASERNTIAQGAAAARTGQQMMTLKSETIASTLSSVAMIDDGKNKIIDVNSMMEAMDDYVNRCLKGEENLGVPLNYYLKEITKSEIAQAWLAKYYPNRFNKAGSADDNGSGSGSSNADSSGGGDAS